MRQREVSILLFIPPNAHSSRAWVRLMPGVQKSAWVSPVGGRDSPAASQAVHQQEVGIRSRARNQMYALQYGMRESQGAS